MSESTAQNIYDHPEFFSSYATLARSQTGLDEAPEWPDLRDMVLGPQGRDLKTQRVLDLGCGYGWFSRWARESGAAHVRAIDVSQRMIERANEFEQQHSASTEEGKIAYEVGDLDAVMLENEPGRYDVVYSSLTFHYIRDMSRLLRQIRTCLRSPRSESGNRGGRVVFSIEHPVFTAPVDPPPAYYRLPGDTRTDGPEGRFWALNSYSEEGPRFTSWLGVDGVRKYHRTIETYLTLLREHGFMLNGFKEFVVPWDYVAKHPEAAEDRHRPSFLLVAAEAI